MVQSDDERHILAMDLGADGRGHAPVEHLHAEIIAARHFGRAAVRIVVRGTSHVRLVSQGEV